MMNETPEAALRSRIADLEQQLKLADEGTSRLAQRCLELEKQLQTFYAAHPQRERQTDSPALVQPLLYYDAGFGFSQKDTVKAPDYEYDELNGMVTATFDKDGVVIVLGVGELMVGIPIAHESIPGRLADSGHALAHLTNLSQLRAGNDGAGLINHADDTIHCVLHLVDHVLEYPVCHNM